MIVIVKLIGESEFFVCCHCFYCVTFPHMSILGYMNPSASVPPPAVPAFGVQQAGAEIDPGSLGQMDSGGGASQGYGNSGDGYGQAGFEDEPPLLQELGIDFELIKQKVYNYRVIPIAWYDLLKKSILRFWNGRYQL